MAVLQPSPPVLVEPTDNPSQDPSGPPQQGPYYDPATGFQIDPSTGYLVHPATGYLIEPETGRLLVYNEAGILVSSGFSWNPDTGEVTEDDASPEPTETPSPTSPPTPTTTPTQQSSAPPAEASSQDPGTGPGTLLLQGIVFALLLLAGLLYYLRLRSPHQLDRAIASVEAKESAQ